LKKAKNVVLDASAILRSDHDFRCGSYLITGSIVDEIKKEADRDAIEAAISAGYIRIASPTKKSLDYAVEKAIQTGDYSVLSSQDIEVLALAYDVGADIASDDYAIQNTAAKMGLKTKTTTADGIKKEIKWTLSCRGCGKIKDSVGECEVCGHKIIRKKTQDHQD
jgi:endoribonuclease Nob1